MKILSYLLQVIFLIMSKSSTNLSGSRKFDIVRTKFNNKITKQLLEILIAIDWSASVESICQQLNDITTSDLDGKYVWLIGANPTYFIQYQIDSYAIMKGYNKVILVWKPKYLEYPSIFKFTDFGEEPKQLKSMEVTVQQNIGDIAKSTQQKISEFLKNYYGLNYHTTQQSKFQTEVLTQLKHLVSKISKYSYWHCAIDNHSSIDVSSKDSLYLKFRIRGVKQKYDKDLMIFSKQGKKEFLLKGKGLQIISFIAMLTIFLAVITCPSQSQTGFCSHKSELIMGGAAIMMGLMGMRIVSRNKDKKKLDKKIQQIQKQQKKQ